MAESRTTPAIAPPGRDARFDIAIVDQSQDAMDAARDAAEARLTNELNAEGGKFRRFVRNVWKGNAAKEVYRQRYILEAAKEINQSQDQFVYTGADDTQKANAQMSTIERMLQQHDEAIHQEAGESREVLDDGSDIAIAAKELVRRYADGSLDEAALKEEQSRVLEAYRISHTDTDDLRRCSVQLDNIIQVARAAKGAVDHGESLDAIMREMRVVSGTERSGARTEHVQTGTDKVIEKLGKSRLGRLSFIAPETMVGVAAVASSAVRVGATIGLGNALRVVAPGVAGGVIALMRESRQVRKERIQHTREMAQGGEIGDNDARRAKMDETRYETRSAVDEAVSIREALSLDAFENGDVAAVHDVMMRVAELQERRRISDADKKDLFSFTSAVSMGAERHDLDMAIIEAKTGIARKLALPGTESELQAMFGGSPTELLLAAREGSSASIEQDVTAKDTLFKKLRRKRVAEKVAIGVTVGATLGVVSQELMAAAQPSLEGVIDHATGQNATLHDGASHQTLLERLVGGGGSNYDAQPQQVADGIGRFDVSGGSATIEDGTMTIEANEYEIQVPVGEDGQLSDEVRRQLEEQGIKVGDSQSVSVDVETTKRVDMTAREFIEHYSGDTTHVTRDLWYDNDTLAPVFDLNEQGLHWGGENGGGVGPDGQIQLSVATMTQDGSFAGDQSVSWQSAAESGNLKIAISATEGTQTHPFMVDINPDGSIDIPQDSPAAQLFSMVDGHMQFNGAYGEVVQTTGVDANGVEHIRPLATMVGTKEWDGGSVPVPQIETQTGYITPIEVPSDVVTELPPIVPVPLPRKSMESIRREPLDSHDSYYGGYGAAPEEWRQQMVTDRISELRQDPSARISLREGLQWHHDLTRRKDPEYADYIEGLVGTMPNLVSLDVNTDTIVPILVGANFEHDNIYRTLSLYAEMPDDWKAKTQLVLHVNWIDSKENDPIEKAKIDKTRSEVLRAIRDFPGLNVSQFESIWSQEKLDKGEYGDRLIAHAAQQLVDVSMAAAYQGMQDGRIPEDHDILLWKGDADARGMSRLAGPRMTKEFKEHPEADAFSGGVRWGTETYKELPGLGFVLNFMEVYRIAAQRAHIKGFQSTFGVNGGARMSTFAGIGGIGHYTNQKHSPPDDGWGDRMFAARNPNLKGTANTYGTSGGQGGANNDYHRHVGGASIDTDASRFEKVYRNNEPITSIWGNVNSNGYQGRTAGLQADQNNDDVRSRPDEVIDRIEYQMSDLISHWTIEPAQIATTLAIMLPGPGDLGGKLAYTITKDASGKSQFSLTPQGKKWLVSRLQFNSKGQYDSYGDRQARQLYGKTMARGRTGYRGSISVKQSPSRMITGRV